MASFASHPCDQSFEAKLVVEGRVGAMTAEAIPRFVTVDVAARSFLQTRGRAQGVADRPVQTIDCAVVTHAPFVEFSFVAEHVCLRDPRIPERIQDGFTNRVFAIRHLIEDLRALTRDLIGVNPRPKGHSRMGSEY